MGFSIAVAGKGGTGKTRLCGMTMEQLFDYQIQQAIIEARGFDLLVMGRPEGAGCYCAANNIIRKYMDQLADTYPYMVVDNEAGLEHLSRRTTQDTDLLLIISDPTVRGVMTGGRIAELVQELDLNVKRSVLIVNRAVNSGDGALQKAIDQTGVEFAGFVPSDDRIIEFDLNGTPLVQLPDDSKALSGYFGILDRLIA